MNETTLAIVAVLAQAGILVPIVYGATRLRALADRDNRALEEAGERPADHPQQL